MYLTRQPEYVKKIYLCSRCGFASTDDTEQRHIDKCPSCRGDDWILFEREEEAHELDTSTASAKSSSELRREKADAKAAEELANTTARGTK